jgi:pimeloyl-ACP methyl ester carboxylesterase
MIKLVEMDEKVTFSEQREENIEGTVILINKFNVKPEEVDHFGQLASSIPHLSLCIVIALFLVIVTSVSINGIGLNSSRTAFAQNLQPQANLTSVEQQQLMEGISFEIDNVTFSHHMASVNGIQLHYVIGGQGDPVVLLHGWPQTWYEWRHIMPALAKNYTVIAPDLRGFGDSSKPITGYDGNTTAEDIYQLISQLGFNNIFLVAHDVGAQAAYSYAAAHPNNVSKLVLMDFPFPGFLPPEFGQNGPWWFAFYQTPDIPETLIDGKEREYLSWFMKGLAYNPSAISEVAIDVFAAHAKAPGGLRAQFEHFRAFPMDAEQNKESAKSKITMPVLVLGGDIYPALGGDYPGNFALSSTQALAANVTGITVPLSGHWIPEEQPQFVIEQLAKFFSG